ncbi:sel1 repeat family protein [Pelomonas sp. V22]|uniref:tetratricopeptide repeat protein n=1 Tax=Pelomonas sp. V22 TaxID=2822139 RepID=UPI0024A9F126|nr:tetratricopeptide repeat protein [Pelomonas sp. V22]MDI4634770.1 sel1 repeat family protein [Pelomonas sp. V22]
MIRGAGLSVLLLVLAGPAPAEDSGQKKQELATVQVSGNRNGGVDPAVVTAAKSKVLSRNYASSCAFMSSYKAGEDAVTLAYMRDFGLQDSPSNEAERLRDTAPEGSAATNMPASSLAGEEVPDPNASSVGCSKADRAFAAGRNWIARKDKSLTQAFDAFEAEDFVQARQFFEAAWNKVGYEEAAMMLGRIHLLGLGTPKDAAQATTWFRQVTDGRYDPVADRMRFDPRKPDQLSVRVDAALMLAKIQMTGAGGAARNPAEARRWYAKALDFGFVPAGHTLAQASLTGYGGEKSARQAFEQFKQAAEAGFAPSQVELARLYYNGTDGQARDLPRAAAWYLEAAKAGHAEAMFAAARMYDLGEGLPLDQGRAIALYKDAALKGHADAQNALATYFYNGQLLKQDLATARKLFQAAATRGQAEAMFNLGVMLTRAEGGEKDLGTAYAWFTLARASGHEQAAAAQAAIAPLMQAEDRARADAILKPKPKP